ncbi:non-specific phospholipase C6-like [Canna indica]|uniref:Non-specific phospholipase C6-like n=1 Tax=Canna indica TaxID=4628 RepID=A0AAQ3K9W7_9LILI|nr:non-specific phospholipase C6-like [Canna indica]
MENSKHQHHILLFLILTFFLLHPHFSAAARQPIKNIVVLVLENRSFDHMLGWMKQSLNPSIDGLTGRECNPHSTDDPNSQLVCVSDDAQFIDPDPGHSFEDVMQQVFGSGAIPSMSGFVQQALSISRNLSNSVMKGFNPESIPVFASLVQEFAVFDRWFSSIPGPTQPNRLFVYSATSHGAIRHDKFNLLMGYPQKTIFDSLEEDGLDFGVYFKNIPTTLFYRNLRRLKYISKFHLFSSFKDHARRGRLPSLSVVEPRYFDLVDDAADDDHPSHDVANGQKLVKEVYEALRSSPQWNQSLLIITYDEHGGFYDHVATPYKGVPNPDGILGPDPFFFKFDRLGVRIPTIMISPWIKKGTVVSRPNGPTSTSEFEHSSIPATIKKLLKLKSDFLTKRDAWAGTFEDIVGQLSSPRTDCPEILPEVPPLRNISAREDSWLSEFQRELVELAAFLNGDYFFTSLSRETSKQMTVREANAYVNRAVSRFLEAGKQAKKLGADGSAIVNMRSSLTSKTTPP